MILAEIRNARATEANRGRRCGFTLIELLIVVAIIGILAAIAVSNFLNARLRASVACTNNDLRALAMAIQSYQVDENVFPSNWSHLTVHLSVLTTPVSYIASVDFRDIFNAQQGSTGNAEESYLYFLYKHDTSGQNLAWIDQANVPQYSTDGFCLSSWGPDRVQGATKGNDPRGAATGPPIEWVYIQIAMGQANALDGVYAPTNGLITGGDIGRWGGNVPGVPQVLGG